MALETGTYISDLVATNPTASDPKSQGDDHLRLIKSTVKTTFPNVTGAVTPTHTVLNYMLGVTSAVQTQLDAKAPLASPALTGTPTAPTASPGTSTTQIATTEFVISQAFSSALPNQSGNNGKYLTTDGSAASWADTVSSVGVSVPAFLSVSGSPVTSSGTIAITYSGTALPVANGGTGVTTSTGSGANVLNTSPSLVTPDYTENIQVISTNTNAVRSRTYVLTATLTLTLPATPSPGDWVGIVNRSGTATPVIGRNSTNIMGLAEDMTLDNENASLTLVYADATRGWIWN